MNENESLPAWERGLKRTRCPIVRNADGVAPRVGAWIETPNHWTTCSSA